MNKRGGLREGSGRPLLDKGIKKTGNTIYINDGLKNNIIKYGKGKSFSEKAVSLLKEALQNLDRGEINE